MKFPRIPTLICCGLMLASFSSAAELTPEQIESLRARLKALKENLDNHLSSRNSGAGQVFAEASGDPKKAMELYLKCQKLVNFDEEGLPESDFRGWKEENEDRMKDPAFVESLQMQLRYLALSCQAAESEKIDTIFPSLLSYVDSLSRMEELPTNAVTGSVARSVFSEAYNLEKLLGDNPNWEAIPFNIGGIYDSVILPYLREKNPSGLMNAWDKRIEQETRIVMMLEEHKEKELRGLNRDQQRRARGNQNRDGGVMGRLDKDDFINEALPRMNWAKLVDMFNYVDQINGAKAMLDFVEENLTGELGEEFFEQFSNLIAGAAAPTPAGGNAPADSN